MRKTISAHACSLWTTSVFALASCAGGDGTPTDDNEIAALPKVVDEHPADLVGEFNQSMFDEHGEPDPGWPRLYLTMRADGSFVGQVMNGITSSGCGTFEGAGSSNGYWALRQGVVVFIPSFESEGLALSLHEATATRHNGGLQLSSDRHECWLVTQDREDQAFREWEARQ